MLGWGTIAVQKYRQVRASRLAVLDYIEEELLDGIQDGDEAILARKTADLRIPLSGGRPEERHK